jgi:hypothetical protein
MGVMYTNHNTFNPAEARSSLSSRRPVEGPVVVETIPDGTGEFRNAPR